MYKTKPASLAISVAAVLAATAGSVAAGGFAVREQSAQGQGASFAGAGASNALSAMFWNSAAVTSLSGMNTDANMSAIIPQGELTATSGTRFNTADRTTDIGVDAYVPASYINYQFKSDPRLFIGLGVNAPFGLKTEPDKRWAGSEVGGSTRLFTINFNPVLGYKISDQLSVGAGPQFQYAKGVFKFATASPTGPNTFFEGDSLAAGATAGITYTPTPSTTIGLGWRSQLTHTLDGRLATGNAAFGGGAFVTGVKADVDLRLPDIVTLSVNHALTPNLRALGTVEWSNWSRFNGLSLVAQSSGVTVLSIPTSTGQTLGKIEGAWSVGWFFSGGLEYDVSKALTVRAGGAYEIAPVRDATQRIISIPDADRIWASVGFSYKISETSTLDFGYSHVFVDEAQLDRTNISKSVSIKADLDASVDIVSVGLRMKLGE